MTTTPLEQRHDDAWRHLQRAAVDRKSPMRAIVLITQAADGHPEGRTVILRQVSVPLRRVWIHTDTRSPKWAEMQHDPRVSLVAWSPRAQLQIRLQGTARLLVEGESWQEQWSRLGPHSRKTYSTPLPPGTPLKTAAKATDPDPEPAHFGVVEIDIRRLDCLWLDREGHVRLEACYQGNQVVLQETAP